MKNIVIVGCSKGIGFAASKILSQENNVIGISRTMTNEVHHHNMSFHNLDILSEALDGIEFPEVIDGLIYAPGSITLKPFNRISDEDFKKDFEINVIGAARIIRKLLPNLKSSGNGAIVLFSTVAAKLGMFFHASIAASKSAVEGLTKSLAAELAPSKIRVNAISPSITDTHLAAQLLSTPAKREGAARRHPLQRIGNAEEMAQMAAYLISDKASWITGQIIGIDGGMGSVRL